MLLHSAPEVQLLTYDFSPAVLSQVAVLLGEVHAHLLEVLEEVVEELGVDPPDEDHLEDGDDEEAGGQARVEQGEEVDAALEAEGQAAQEEGHAHPDQNLGGNYYQ